ncbi:MAG TPA: substrate-binding domain-containing protein [Streptosporangiaceae bacterium]|nr:substrate-binding domain-containing protein [Streptosporangiaceae bacterium]
MNAGVTGHPQGRDRRGRPRRRTLITLTLVGVIAATLLVALGAKAVVARTSCTDHPVVVSLAAADEVAPAIRHVSKYFNAQRVSVDGHCAVVHVASVQPSTAAAEVSGLKSLAGHAAFDAWIPDSSLWVNVARSSPVGSQLVQSTGVTVAKSPLMIVMPRSVAAQMPAFGTEVGWQFLLPQRVGGPASALDMHVEFPDPAQSSAGLATLIELQGLLQHQLHSTAKTLAAFTDFVFNVQVTKDSGGDGALASLASLAQPSRGSERPVTIASEQAVAQFDRSHPSDPLSGRYPVEGTPELDYPYVLTTSNRLKLKAARDFEKTLQSSYATSYVRYEGFRSATGSAPSWIGQYGLNTGKPALSPATANGEAETSLQAWQRLSLGSRDLVLLDVSKQMATPVAAGGPTLEQVLAKAAGLGLSQFPDGTQMGVWAFAAGLNNKLPYKQLVSLGPLPAPLGLITRRQQITSEAGLAKPVPAPAALYGSILAGFKQVSSTYQARYDNAVLVMTAGVDNAPGDISAPELVRQLRTLYNPKRRVEIIIIKFGSAGDFNSLQRIAGATGGQAYDITNPTQISKVFFSAVARRLCSPNCGA